MDPTQGEGSSRRGATVQRLQIRIFFTFLLDWTSTQDLSFYSECKVKKKARVFAAPHNKKRSTRSLLSRSPGYFPIRMHSSARAAVCSTRPRRTSLYMPTKIWPVARAGARLSASSGLAQQETSKNFRSFLWMI